MERRSSAYYQRRHRDRLREQGLIKKELWVRPEYAEDLAAIERRMRLPPGAPADGGPAPAGRRPPHGEARRGEPDMGVTRMGETTMRDTTLWTPLGLYEALRAAPQAADGAMTVELIEGAEPSLLLTMHDFGDLPLFLAVGGQQIVVEALLWPVAMVRDPARFNEDLLRTHKLLPLSTLGIESLADGSDAYIMFGALSASSALAEVLFEVETLADNVIQVTEAYAPHLHQEAA